MIFRKQRSPSRQQVLQLTLLPNNIQQPHPFYRSQSPRKITTSIPKPNPIQPTPIDEQFKKQFRKMYAGRKDVRKSLKSWGFLPYGHITGQSFTEQMNKSTNLSLGKGDLVNSKGLITAQSFVNMAFGSNIACQSKLSNFWECNPYRQQFLENYNDKVYNQDKLEVVNGSYGVERVMRRVNPSVVNQIKEVPRYFTQRDQPHCKRDQQTNIKPSLPLQHKIKGKILQTSTIQLGSDPLYMKIKQEKDEVEDGMIKRVKRLQRIRRWHQLEKENIDAKDRQREKRQQANKARSRGQKEAYQFVAYCKNRWG